MLRISAVLLVFAGLVVPGIAPGTPTERIPTKTFDKAYPRWLAPVNPRTGGSPYEGKSVAVDSRNVVHTVSRDNDGVYGPPGTFRDYVVYQNNRFDTRRSSGFSDREKLDAFEAEYDGINPAREVLGAPDVWVHSNDTIHVVWPRYFYDINFNLTYANLYYRQKTSSGWGGIVNLTPAAQALGDVHSKPQIAVDSTGLVHVVAYSGPNQLATFPPPPPKAVHITYSGGVPSGSVITGAEPAIGNIEADRTIRFVLDSLNVPWVVWMEQSNVDPFPSEVYYSSKTGGGWSAKTAFGGMPQKSGGPDIAVDSAGNFHFVWVKETAPGVFGVYYRGLAAGSLGAESQVSSDPFPLHPASGYNLLSARVITDSRRQIHVLWSGLSYAARVLNPDPDTVGLQWQRQEKVVHPTIESLFPKSFMYSPDEVAITKNDQIHAVDRQYYIRTMDYELGVRDPASLVEAFPGAKANVTNGNLHFGLGLYQTHGVGPTQSLNLAYNSLEPFHGLVAPGWKFNYETHIVDHYIDDQNPDVTLYLADGRAVHFYYSSSSGYLTDDTEFGFSGRLDRIGGDPPTNFKLTTGRGVEIWFNPHGKLDSVVEPTGNKLAVLWDADGRLVQIQDMLGNGGTARTGYVDYEIQTNQLYSRRASRVTDPGGKWYDFNYAGNHLGSVTFTSGPGAPTHAFEYYGANNISTFARVNMLSRYLPPRGSAGGYGYGCAFLQDNRMVGIIDPSEVLLLDAEDDLTAPAARIATLGFSYNESLPDNVERETTVSNRRVKNFLYVNQPRQSLSTKIWDPTALAGTVGIFPVARAFDDSGNLKAFTDRWGFITKYGYLSLAPTHPSPYVRLLLSTVEKPNPSGTGWQVVEARNYTFDYFNNLDTVTTYATPADGSAPVARVTDYDYNAFAQLVTVKHPDVTRPDGIVQSNVTRVFEYGGPRRQISRAFNGENHFTDFSNYHPVHGLPRSTLSQGGSQPVETDFDAVGNVTQTKRPRGGSGNDIPDGTIFGLDGMYRTQTLTDPGGKVTTNTYDVDSNLVSVLPPLGGARDTTYDKRGFVSGGNGPDGSWSQWVDAEGNVRRTRSLRGYDTNTDFDSLDRAVEKRAPGATTLGPSQGGGGPLLTIRWVHDGFDIGTSEHFSTVTQVGLPPDPDRVTRTNYDNRARPKSVLAADTVTLTENFFDEQDQTVATQLKFNGILQTATVTFRDARDRVDRLRVQDTAYGAVPNLQSNAYTLYNKANAVVRTVDPLGAVSNTASFAHKVTYLLDARERVQFVQDGFGVTVKENVWGDDDHLVEVKIPDPATKSAALVTGEKRTYTARKELKSFKNRNDIGTAYAYTDIAGNLDTATDAFGRVTKTTYYPTTQRVDEVIAAYATPRESRSKSVWTNGLLTETRVWNPATSAYDATYRYLYDQFDRVERFEAPLVSPERYGYNSFSQDNLFDAGTKTVQHSYNRLGQRMSSSWSGAFSAVESRTYNGIGLVESVSNGAREKVMLYDTWRGTPMLETFRVSNLTWKFQTHAYDLAKNYVGLVDPESGVHDWIVDENNRVKEIKFANKIVCAIAYTPGGLVDQTTLKDVTGATIAQTSHLYDGLGRKSRQFTVQTATSKILSDFQWGYNDLNQVTTLKLGHLGTSSTLLYDERGQFTGESVSDNGNGLNCPPYTNQIGAVPTGNESTNSNDAQGVAASVVPVPTRATTYVWDKAGNRTSMTIDDVTTTFVHNAASQLTSESAPGLAVSHVYDEWGNETTRTAIQGGTTTTETYGYNYLNFMSSYVKQVNLAVSANWQYEFWPTGERYGKTNLIADSSELYIPRFGDVVTEYDKLGAAAAVHKNTYAQGTRIDTKCTRIAQSGTRRHMVGDLVGTVGLTLDDAASVQDTSVKDGWGIQFAGAATERYGYAQREQDGETGLVHMRARMYDPRLGRFTQRDPIAANRPFEHFVYGLNNPISRIDPLGSESLVPGSIPVPAPQEGSGKDFYKELLGEGDGTRMDPLDPLKKAVAATKQFVVDTAKSVDPNDLAKMPEYFEGLVDGFVKEYDNLKALAENPELFAEGMLTLLSNPELVNRLIAEDLKDFADTPAGDKLREAGAAAAPYLTGKLLGILREAKKKGTLDKLLNAAKRKLATGGHYRARYNAHRKAHGRPLLPDDWDAHHRIPQQYRNHPEFKDFDFDDPENIRGVKRGVGDANIHQNITNKWAEFTRTNPKATREQIEKFARDIDKAHHADWFK